MFWPFKPNVRRMRRTENIPGLIRALTSNDEKVQSDAASALVDLGGRRVTAALCATLENVRERTEARRAAVKLLGRMGDTSAVLPLLEACYRWDLRQDATVSLELLAPFADEHMNSLLRAGLQSGYWWVRCGAARALRATGRPPLPNQDAQDAVARQDWDLVRSIGPEALAPLAAFIAEGPPDLQVTALDTMTDLMKYPEFVEPLCRLLAQQSAGVAWAACESMQKVADYQLFRDPIFTRLAELAREKPYDDARRFLGFTVPRRVEPLCWLLGHSVECVGKYPKRNATDEDISMDVLGILRDIGDRQALPYLCLALFEIRYACVVQMAAIALGRIGDAAAVECLLAALGRLQWSGRCIDAHDAIIIALGRLRDPRAVTAITNYGDGHGWGEYKIAPIEALAAIADRSAIQALCSWLCSMSPIDDPYLHGLNRDYCKARLRIAEVLEDICKKEALEGDLKARINEALRDDATRWGRHDTATDSCFFTRPL